ncbi:hypothetical protein [Shewanella frigidimarina]|uniref:hypothetical protein n=1 Tax=Shewanella frigidimarina TaxID=56812 RepID=UPI000F4FA6B1|nr:hypothetical protein [Shewanella frigidimarina]RPA23026.1 hypothetical protein EGC78_20530 [Shewanella frigidimarina]
MNQPLLDAINQHQNLLFMGCGGTNDIETCIELLELLLSLINEANDLHVISSKHIVRQLNCIQMMLSVGLTQVRATKQS